MLVELGEQLRSARTARGLSLEVASRAAKISQGYLHKLEAGQVKSPSPRVLQRLSEVLGISYRRLMKLADYLMPDEGGSQEAGAIEEEKAMAQTNVKSPTNSELARLLEKVLCELAEVRRDQKQLAQALARKK
jgi:transcriptional regulator with XRE-family HTH domain